MENHKQIIWLLLFLKRLGIKFNVSEGYYHKPIQVLGKFEPVEFTINDMVIVTTEEMDE